MHELIDPDTQFSIFSTRETMVILGGLVSCFYFGLAMCRIYGGPYIMWGLQDIDQIKLPALEAVQPERLLSIYQNLKYVYLFVLDSNYIAGNQSFNDLKSAIGTSKLAYLAQANIPDPLVNGVEVHVIALNGNDMNSLAEQKKAFNDIKESTETDNVLGMLAIALPIERSKRQAEVSDEMTTVSSTDEPMRQDFVYKSDGKIILYTTAAPVLYIDQDTGPELIIRKELKSHGLVTVDEREQYWRLSVTFAVEGGKTTLRFKFPISGGYWYLNQVEVVDRNFSGNLTVVGEAPGAPFGFSYKCSRELSFQKNTTNLTLFNVQVQPLLAGANQFGDAYYCVGFTTVPIWSGIFITFLLLLAMSFGIIALMEIKPPSKFECNRSKQLTFTIQE